MNFSGLGQSALADFSYDSTGNLWALENGGVVRWDLKTSNLTTYTALDGLPENLSYLTIFQGKALAESEDGEISNIFQWKVDSQ